MDALTVFTWIITAMSLWGVWLNIKKDKRCFYIWIVANFGWIAVDIEAGLYAQAALFGIYSLLSVYGLVEWSRDERVKLQAKEA